MEATIHNELLAYVDAMVHKAAAGELVEFVDSPPPASSGLVDAPAMLLDALLVDACADRVGALVRLGVRVTPSRLLRHALVAAASGAMPLEKLGALLRARTWGRGLLAEACMRVIDEEAAPAVALARAHHLRAGVALRMARGQLAAPEGSDYEELEAMDALCGTSLAWGLSGERAAEAYRAARAEIGRAARFAAGLSVALSALCADGPGPLDEVIGAMSGVVGDVQALKHAHEALLR